MQRLNRIMAREIERIRAAAPGERNATLNKVAYTLAGYAHLGLAEHDAQQECNAAGIAAGLEPGEIARSFRSGWDGGIKHPCEIIERPYKEILYDFDENSICPCIDVEFLDEQPIMEPDIATYDGRQDLIRYLEAVFEPEEYVGYCVSARQQETKEGKVKWIPASSGSSDRTAGQLLTELRAATEIGAVLGDPEPDAGAWIRFNPLDGQGIKDENITAYRFALVEGDDGNIDRQAAIYEALQLPCAAIVHSAGKSLHAIVRIDAKDLAEYRSRVKYLYAVMEKNGLVVDTQNKNPSRLSRLPGVERAGKPQFLLHTNTGKATWDEWKEYIEELNDDLPDFETMFSDEQWYTPPEKAPEIIQGILRQGHKMLISGASKAGKSFLLLELAISIAEGKQWLGYPVRQGKVIYVNFELDKPSCQCRVIDQYKAMGWTTPPPNHKNIIHWPLRGKADVIDKIMPKLIRRAKMESPMVIIIDPIYKVLNGDESSAHEMALFCNQFDRLCDQVGCAAIYCHHHSKGEQGQKAAHERASGSGVFSRDPDAILDLIELHMKPEQRDFCIQKLTELRGKEPFRKLSAWRIEGTLREFPPVEKTAIFYDYPLHYLDEWELLGNMKAAGEDAKGEYVSVSDQVRNAAKAIGKDLADGILIDDIACCSGLSVESITKSCDNSSSGIALSPYDNCVRTDTTHRFHMLAETFKACQVNGEATRKDMAETALVSTKTIGSWLKLESAFFSAKTNKPVKLTKEGEQKISLDDEDEHLF